MASVARFEARVNPRAGRPARSARVVKVTNAECPVHRRPVYFDRGTGAVYCGACLAARLPLPLSR